MFKLKGENQLKPSLKKACAVLLAGVLTVSLTACAQAPAQPAQPAAKAPIVIKYPTFQVGVNTSAPVLEALVKDFNAKYGSEVKIEIEEIPGDANYVEKMKVLLSSDQLPDIVYAGGYNLLDMGLAKKSIVDLTPYLEKDSEWKAVFDKRTLDYNSREGKVYSLPDESSLIGYFYNKELFKKAGIDAPAKTWDEFFADCKKLKAAGITPLSMDTADSGWITSLWQGGLIGTSGDTGNTFMDTMMPTDYQTPEFLTSTKQIQTMLKEYTTPDAIGGKYENGANNFLSGKTAMIANGVWMTGDFSDETKTAKGFADKVGVAMYPGDGMYNAPMLGYFIAAKDPAHIEASVKVLKYLTSKESQMLALSKVGRVPSSPTVKPDAEITKKYPLLADALTLSGTAKHQFNYLQATMYPNVNDLYSQDLPALAAGKMSPDDFCKALSDAAKKNK